MRRLMFATLALGFAFSTTASAAPCRDANGKFVTCPKVSAKKCHDAKGKFMKCAATSAKSA